MAVVGRGDRAFAWIALRGRAQVSALKVSPLDGAGMDGYAMCAVDVALGESSSLCKAVLDMTARVEKQVAGFARYRKYKLGTELRQAT